METEGAGEALIDAIFDNRKLIDDLAEELMILARAASLLGQGSLSERLTYVADEMRLSAKAVVDAHGRYLSDYLKRDQEAVAGNIKAMLSMARLTTPPQ